MSRNNQMNWGRSRNGKNRNVFKGSVLVSALLERHPRRFRSRASAVKFARRLFRDGTVKSIFGADTFEDSVQLYMWQEDEAAGTRRNMTSSSSSAGYARYNVDQQGPDQEIVEDVKNKILNRGDHMSLINSFFRNLEEDLTKTSEVKTPSGRYSSFPAWNPKRASTASSESSVENNSQTYVRLKATARYPNNSNMAHFRDHEVIPEESQEEQIMSRTDGYSMDYDITSGITRALPSNVSTVIDIGDQAPRRWNDAHYSYSDNEKQLMEEIKKMKKEHQYILRSYEDRINKLMAKMHELRSIAEMLENSSTKSSPYGILPGKGGLLNLIGSKLDQERRQAAAALGQDGEIVGPPPLPPRPERGRRVYPNKPIINPQEKMKPLPWSRIILKDTGSDDQSVIWHTVMEPKLDIEEIERLYMSLDELGTDGSSLYDDIVLKRGRLRHQLLAIFDAEKSRRIVYAMRSIHYKLDEMINAAATLDRTFINQDSLAELLELIGSGNDIDRILQHVKKKGAGQLDHPEYLVFELSKLDNFRDRVEFLRFKYRLQWHLFETDQQLRELHTACDEISNSLALKNLLETMLAVGNFLNGGTEQGQADGFGIDVINKLKEMQDRDCKGNLLEFVLKLYCQYYETEIDVNCPTRFRLPEPSNMRHAAQVSFEGIQDLLSNIHAELRNTREKLLEPHMGKDNSLPPDYLRTTAENFFAAALEVIGEQERLLQDTRDFFQRTAAYFMYDNNPECSPQQFFQIWAMFLHDCKYYWKLAHRKLARERFELDFKYKGQKSASSLHGMGGFRSSMLQSLKEKPDVKSTHHINNWVESVEKYSDPPKSRVPAVPPKGSSEHLNYEPNQKDLVQPTHRSPSPKPFTATPPTSGSVHKPLAKPPFTPNGNVYSTSPPNYENQTEVDRLVSNSQTPEIGNYGRRRTELPPPSEERDQKKAGQFSLKSLMKRDPNRRGAGGEVTGSKISSPEVAKHPSSGTTLNRLRNSVMQKLTGSAKRAPDMNSPTGNEQLPNLPPSHMSPESEITPYASSYVRDPRYGVSSNVEKDYQSYHILTAGSHRNETPERESRPRPSSKSPGRSPHRSGSSTEGVQSDQIRTVHSDRKSSKVLGENTVPCDINNNDDRFKPKTPEKPSRGRTRAPIALGSNISISDMYSRGNSANTATVSPTPQKSGNVNETPTAPQSGSDPKWIKTDIVPVYKAKILHNYENQGKYDPSLHAVRQQAEPVGDSPETNFQKQENVRQDNQRNSDYQSSSAHDRRHAAYSHSSGADSGLAAHPSRTSDSRTNSYITPPSTDLKQTSTHSGLDTRKNAYLSQGPVSRQTPSAHTPENAYLSQGPVSRQTPSAHTPEKRPTDVSSAPALHSRQTFTSQGHTSGGQGYTPTSGVNVRNQRGTRQYSSYQGRQQTQTGYAERRSERDLSPGQQSDGKPDSRKYLTPGNRAPMNAHSITSLIERFEKTPESKPVGAQVVHSQPTGLQGKPLAMTSTPVLPRKSQAIPQDDGSSPPLPPRTDQKSGRHQDSGSHLPSNTASQYTSPGYSKSHQHPYTSPSGTSASHSSSGYYSSTPSRPSHSRENTGISDQDDGYKEQLRKAASSSRFDRYAKTGVAPYSPTSTYSATSPPSSSQHAPYYRHVQGNEEMPTGGVQPGAMAVVKPTIVHQGNLTFMDI